MLVISAHGIFTIVILGARIARVEILDVAGALTKKLLKVSAISYIPRGQ